MFNVAEDASNDIASLTHGRGSLEGHRKEQAEKSPSKLQYAMMVAAAVAGLSGFLAVNWLIVKILKIVLPGYIAKFMLFLAYYYAARMGVRQAAFPGCGKLV